MHLLMSKMEVTEDIGASHCGSEQLGGVSRVGLMVWFEKRDKILSRVLDM